MSDPGITATMSSNESDFDKLLRETREWEARDRARHKSFNLDEDGDAQPSAPRSQAPQVTIEELTKRVNADLKARPEPATKAVLQERAQTITAALKAAMEQKKAQAQASPRKRSNNWGWVIWVPIILYFVVKRFLH